jgi:hypothetical protein
MVVIARHCRDRKGKTLPRLNADERGSKKIARIAKIAEIESKTKTKTKTKTFNHRGHKGTQRKI